MKLPNLPYAIDIGDPNRRRAELFTFIATTVWGVAICMNDTTLQWSQKILVGFGGFTLNQICMHFNERAAHSAFKAIKKEIDAGNINPDDHSGLLYDFEGIKKSNLKDEKGEKNGIRMGLLPLFATNMLFCLSTVAGSVATYQGINEFNEKKAKEYIPKETTLLPEVQVENTARVNDCCQFLLKLQPA